MSPASRRRALRATIKVGGGRGFVIKAGPSRIGNPGRHVVTAAHCLPNLPPPHGMSYLSERTFGRLLGRLGEAPAVWAECLFVDPIRDIAVLTSPDTQELPEEAEAYEQLVFEHSAAVAIADIPESSARWNGNKVKQTSRLSTLWVLDLEGNWMTCSGSTRRGADILLTEASKGIAGGMSGSPILTQDGVVGLITLSVGNPHPRLTQALPGWLLRPIRPRAARRGL